MSPISNPTLLFNAIPKGKPNDTTFKYTTDETIDLEAPLEGGFIVKTLFVSLDPYMRGKMRDPDTKSYTPPFPLHQPIRAHGIGIVTKSESEKYKTGDHLYGIYDFKVYSRFTASDTPTFKVIENKENLPWSTYIGAAGMPGLTAFAGWQEISEAKKGEVAFVSAASGPVGQMVIQIAKSQGLKVIASAGSDEKVAFCKELGADVAFNYKKENAAEIFEKHGPIDVNWVNVGGTAFETELQYMNEKSRAIFCGWISAYNGDAQGIRNLFQIVGKGIKFQGFIVSKISGKYEDDFYATYPAKLASGEFKFKEHVYEGLDQAPKAFLEMFEGVGFGKVLLKVSDE